MFSWWQFAFVSFLNILSWDLARFEQQTAFVKTFIRSQVCARQYGEILAEYHEMSNELWCLNKCKNAPSCKSCTLRNSDNTRTCSLNSEALEAKTNTGCEVLVDYAEIMMEDVLGIHAPITLCQLNGCTEGINSYRLCNGGNKGKCEVSKGRLEVYHNKKWGTICDDFWRRNAITNTHVACRIFGFSYGKLLSRADYEVGTGTIWLDNVECTGSEHSLEECHRNMWGIHNCDHDEDIGVSCYN